LSSPVLSVPATGGGDVPGSSPFANILGATDLSYAAPRIVEQASSLARQTGAALAFVHVQEGAASRLITDTASKNGAELSVIGRRTRARMNHVVMNSTTAKVLRGARCPVLVVPMPQTTPARKRGCLLGSSFAFQE